LFHKMKEKTRIRPINMTRKDNPGVIAPPPLIFICFLFQGYFLNRFYPIAILEEPLNTIISAIFLFMRGSLQGLRSFI
jgi:hypothetical protein